MQRRCLQWVHGWAPLGLASAGLLLLIGAFEARSAAVQTPPPARGAKQIEPPSAVWEELWATVGLNDAWYVTNGYTASPPPSALSPFWPVDAGASVKTSETQAATITVTPSLILIPRNVAFYAYADRPGPLSATISISNNGGGTLRWVAQLAPGGAFTPTLVPTSGLQGEDLTLIVDPSGYPRDTGGMKHTRRVIVSATPENTVNSPQVLTASLYTASHATYLPLAVKGEPVPDLAEVRAIWVTRYDWTSLYSTERPADIDEIVANVAGAGFNTLFFQVRAHGDAYYTPGLEPWSARLNDDGALGQAPGWDPLARMIDRAHARGIAVHAYVNVYPAWLGRTPPPEHTTPDHVYWTWSRAYADGAWRHWHQSGISMSLNSGYLWASPGVDDVRDHTVDVISDIVTRYAVDGVHLDLVRYANGPYSYDPISNFAAGSEKTPARDQWQRERVTDLVGRVYTAIRTIRPQTRLSAAVWFCYYADGCGYGLSSGYANYYQDSLGWLSAGVIDAIAPMLYQWSGFDDFEVWRDVMQQFLDASAGRHVYPGISGDLVSFNEIASRIEATRAAGAAGHAIFSYAAVDARGYWDDFASGPYAQPARPTPLS